MTLDDIQEMISIYAEDAKICEELGFDGAINYKTASVSKSLRKLCPDGIDIYFENVGGKILDAILAQMNKYGRISVCGMISQYNATEPVPGPYNFVNILTQRLKVQGFIVLDYLDRTQECVMNLAQWIGAGKMKYRADIVEGLDQAPIAVNKLFEGTNQGKLIIKVSE